jgi:hypothetical protein
MSWISRLFNQTATYWAPTGHTDMYGTVSFAAPAVKICRWEDRIEKFLGPTGREEYSAAVVWTDDDLEVGGWLYLGTSTEANPEDQSKAFIIRRFDKVFDIKGNVIEHRTILTTIRSVNVTVG